MINQPIDDRNLTLREAFEKFYLPHLDENERSDRTSEGYRHTLNCWEKRSDNPAIAQIDDDGAKTWQAACQKAGLSHYTINRHWGHLRAVLRRLGPQEYKNPQGRGILERVPYLRPLPIRRGIPRFVKHDELNRLYRACESADWPRTIIPPPDWWRTLIVVAYNCGARYRDLLALSPANFDLHERVLEFEAEKTRKQHIIPLNLITLAHVARIWSPREKLFPTGSWPKKVRTEWHELQDLAGIENHFTFHDLRRTCATVHSKVRADLGPMILGHSINTVTHMSYLNPVELLRDAVERVEQPSEFLRVLEGEPKSVVMQYLMDRQRSKWEFKSRSALYAGKEIKLHPRRLAVLRALVAAGRPLSFEDLRNTVWFDSPKASKTVIKSTVNDLSNDLKRALELPDGWDPIPWKWKTGWYVDFPMGWNS